MNAYAGYHSSFVQRHPYPPEGNRLQNWKIDQAGPAHASDRLSIHLHNAADLTSRSREMRLPSMNLMRIRRVECAARAKKEMAVGMEIVRVGVECATMARKEMATGMEGIPV